VAFLLAVMGVLAWLVTLAARGILLMAIGQNFSISMQLAPILVISRGIGGLVLVGRAALLARKQEKLAFGVFLGVAICAFFANLVVIPQYGLLGATIVEISQEIMHLAILAVLLASAQPMGRTSIVLSGTGQDESAAL
jgi:O-antigen/teichoic acid export membrane protein